ncbi:uncharacterized protein LOC131079034 isoform X1 [Cryptomeria japonica]|uniref:uncharacterized protein LOC131079034 isoform X1 n=2 Tax=Cryptomeria japonica TaxID=3369 RepID=UPI0027DAB3D9|nr:uncharacterized protein LOC131079034 isoform X1 [Cryptomeria japonica]XP_057872885.2 uncharacterized protein LOC131079034 isoform X1 [Cryptomeria japonica]XP_057872886.2 uncharacterized protein LOC131079034 isoform X1 [Cryptomeria japonica]XP_057872888.2 uncharacterized protein LOC131079034 isoform X1 [Cryptomeria japonica]XP_057872889.2 uncharacterized protein LOC131079034 isoform X1 [Cryptomeria japonica]XP_057872891.2 uncharacterized protein LOC131079034 isoform X1 [Cryptomeria japonica]
MECKTEEETSVGKREHFETPAKPPRGSHGRSHSSAPENEADHWDVSPQAFHNIKAGWKRMKRSIDITKRNASRKDRQTSLEKDVALLEMKLQGQLAVREALENALGQVSTIDNSENGRYIPKQTEEMIREIAELESEVQRLEQHLLLLYRKVFEHNVSNNPSTSISQEDYSSQKSYSGPLQPTNGFLSLLKQSSNLVQRSQSSLSQSSTSSLQQLAGGLSRQMHSDFLVQRSHSSLSSTSSAVKFSPPLYNSPQSGLERSSHSQPLCLAQELEGRVARLADHLGTSIANHVDESPNRLSEDLVHCMAAIYCKLAEPPLPNIGFSSSPTSSLSSSSTFSPRDQCEAWSPSGKNDGQCDAKLVDQCDIKLTDPFQVKRTKKGVGAYASMVEVPWICVDNDRLSYAARMLHTFKSYVRRLEKVDLKGLKHEEKLAFWINIYNALMMHAYLAYGIPRNHLKRAQLLLKAAYKVGGHSINAHIIESILGCRLHRPSQWLQTLQTLLSAGMKFRAGDERQACTLNHSEPLVCFALCCGGHSDPAVRVYTAKNIYQELEAAKEEYIHASVGVSKAGKVMLPKLLEGFAHDSSLSLSSLLDIVCRCLPETQRADFRKCSLNKPHKSIEWLPYNFNFRYIFSRELAKWTPPLLS